MKPPPLQGIRVIEHSQLLAIPAAVRALATLGAEVIKIEPAFRLDAHRQTTFPDNEPGERFWDRGGTYHSENRGKFGLTLNLRKPEAVEIFRDLVRVSDVVMENFTPRVMKQFGLDYESLTAINPDLIMLSSTGYGHTGPWTNFKAVGPTTESASGLGSVTGYENGLPLLPDVPYTDYTAADQAVYAVLLALYRRRRTGAGGFIDLSQVEAQASLAGELFMDAAANGAGHRPRGTRNQVMEPHDFFPCAGADRWIAIAVSSDLEWQGLVAAMGNPAWAQGGRFDTLAQRSAARAELQELVSAWTRERDPAETMHLLQRFGVPAGAVMDGRDLVTNEHLHAREFFEWITHAPETRIDDKPYAGEPWRFSESARGEVRPAPMLGEHNVSVLRDLLGYSEERIAAIEASGAFGGSPDEFPVPNPVPLDALKARGNLVDIDREYRERIAAMRPRTAATTDGDD